MLNIYAQSTPYIQVPITNTEGIDPTADVVQFAFLGPYGNVSQANEAVPTSSTAWYTGFWENNVSPYIAAILIGPNGGAVTLSSGSYLVLVKITDSPEIPVLFSGPLVVS